MHTKAKNTVGILVLAIGGFTLMFNPNVTILSGAQAAPPASCPEQTVFGCFVFAVKEYVSGRVIRKYAIPLGDLL